MIWFQNIWSIEDNWWNSDIDIITNPNWKTSLYKKYPNFTVWQIKRYHEIQNSITTKSKTILLDNPVTLLWNRITEIYVDILKLSENKIYEAYDINTRKKITISNPDYIEWIWTFNNYLKNIEYQKSKEIKKMIEDSLILDNLYYTLSWTKFEISQLSTFNIKVISIINWKMELLITDIAQKVEEMIKD